ncbi:hypothetical protein BGZ46_008197, partial [Entomortierella lignicola]
MAILVLKSTLFVVCPLQLLGARAGPSSSTSRPTSDIKTVLPQNFQYRIITYKRRHQAYRLEEIDGSHIQRIYKRKHKHKYIRKF